jgi:hypothetical protein
MNSDTNSDIENAALRAAGWDDEDIALMSPKRRAHQVKEALNDNPSRGLSASPGTTTPKEARVITKILFWPFKAFMFAIV